MNRAIGWTWDAAFNVTFLFAIALIVTGCGGTLPVVPARTAIPVECKEPKPQRPAMPTDNLTPATPLDSAVQAMQAEIALREGYEGQLVTALDACTKPINPSPRSAP
jgi:PBP1b-binding outer membrane lipoprotein LpoB